MELGFKRIVGLHVIILAFINTAHCQTLDCSQYKTGRFVVYDSEHGDTFIKRTRKIQKEKGVDPVTGKKTKLKHRIVWVSECAYRLRPLKIKDENGSVKDDVLTFTIINVESDHCIVKLTSGLGSFEIEVKIYKQ